MSNSMADPSAATLRNRLDGIRATEAKPLKKLEEPWRERVGGAIDRAISLAGLTQKEAWVLLNHSDGAQLSRWIAGTERPQFDALFSVEQLQRPLVVSLAKLAGITVRTSIEFEERKSA